MWLKKRGTQEAAKVQELGGETPPRSPSGPGGVPRVPGGTGPELGLPDWGVSSSAVNWPQENMGEFLSIVNLVHSALNVFLCL